MPAIAFGVGTKWFHREGVPDQDDALEAALLGASPLSACSGITTLDAQAQTRHALSSPVSDKVLLHWMVCRCTGEWRPPRRPGRYSGA